jgi:hypothetical protein
MAEGAEGIAAPALGSRAMLVAAWRSEVADASTARAHRDARTEWAHLERAHILSQPMALRHVRTHASMLSYALRQHDSREVLGQIFRLGVAAPGSWTGRYPIGNTGGANVSAFRPMPIPDDLLSLLTSSGAPRPGGRC